MPKQVNDSILTSWSETLGVRIEERRLAGDRCGIYYDPLRLIIIDERLAGFQRRCTLCHELIHARHHDPGCGTRYGIKCERRCRRETALALISPVDYGMAETVYEGNTWMMAVELGVTIQVLEDYRQLLYDSACACSDDLYTSLYGLIQPHIRLNKKKPQHPHARERRGFDVWILKLHRFLWEYEKVYMVFDEVILLRSRGII